jgi:AraC-like DNA-binding protein
MEVGFSSLGSFSDLFARRVGMPPSAWRHRARAMVTVPGVPPKELFPGCLLLMPAAFAIFEKHSRDAFGTLGA